MTLKYTRSRWYQAHTHNTQTHSLESSTLMFSLISSTHSLHSNTLIGIKHNVILMTLIDFKYTLMTLKHTLVYLRHTLMTPKHTLMIVMHTLIEMILTLMVWKRYHINFDTDYTP